MRSSFIKEIGELVASLQNWTSTRLNQMLWVVIQFFTKINQVRINNSLEDISKRAQHIFNGFGEKLEPSFTNQSLNRKNYQSR